MSVLLVLLIAPVGLLTILGLSWFEDRVLAPPPSPGEQVIDNAQGREPGIRIVRAARR
jgi:hypothetical protein